MAGHKMEGEYIVDGVYFNLFTDKVLLTELKNLDLTPDDVLLIAYPRTGSMWMQDMLYRLHHPVTQATNDFILTRVPQLEVDCEKRGTMQHLEYLQTRPKPRIFKTHLQPSFLGKKILQSNCKMVLLLRNPKDCLVSFYHLYCKHPILAHFKGSWDQFFDSMVKTNMLMNGDWFDFATKWWQTLHSKPNVCTVKYEDMKRRPAIELKKLAEFCNLALDDNQLADIVTMTQFEKSRENDSLGLQQPIGPLHRLPNRPGAGLSRIDICMRKGEVGNWKEYFNHEQNEYIDCRLVVLKRETGIEFDL